jgi:limonene-1,2-epoxide hydrolase
MTEAKIKEIVNEINEAFSRNDTEGFLKHCTDSINWNMVGHKTTSGKESVRSFLEEMKCPEPPVFSVDKMIVTSTSAVCCGDMTMKDAEEAEASYSYCDIYEFTGDKVSEMLSYVIKRQDAGTTEAVAA